MENKNCLTCKWEPEWEFWDILGQIHIPSSLYCHWSVKIPFGATVERHRRLYKGFKEDGAISIFEYHQGDKCPELSNCPAHQPKATTEG